MRWQTILISAMVLLMAVQSAILVTRIKYLKAHPIPEVVYTGDRWCAGDKLSEYQYIVTIKQ